MKIAERFWLDIENIGIKAGNEMSGDLLEKLISEADKYLHQAKDQGRNRVGYKDIEGEVHAIPS
ncbi:MAG: hypothetical protein KAU21_03455 [Gammaproteobacteria bacterium]|nr:hypothetical protein [Gammaproteobacteria bacterium]